MIKAKLIDMGGAPTNDVVLISKNGAEIGRAAMRGGYLAAIREIGVTHIDKHVFPAWVHLGASERRAITNAFGGSVDILPPSPRRRYEACGQEVGP